MAHELDQSNGRDNIAFLGSRNDVWHRLGQEMAPGMTVEQWRKAAGLDWHAVLVEAIPDLSSPQWDHVSHLRGQAVSGQRFIVRSDTAGYLGYSTDGYQPVQPAEV